MVTRPYCVSESIMKDKEAKRQKKKEERNKEEKEKEKQEKQKSEEEKEKEEQDKKISDEDEQKKEQMFFQLKKLRNTLAKRGRPLYDGYRKWMLRGDPTSPYTILVTPHDEIFGITDQEVNIIVDARDMYDLWTNNRLDIGVVTLFEWSLYQKLNSVAKEKMFFLMPNTISEVYIKTDEERVLGYLMNVLYDEKNANIEFFVGAYFQSQHWVLYVVHKQQRTIYLFDSLHKAGAKPEKQYKFTKCLNEVLGIGVTWRLFKCNKQNGGWECGYYTMKFLYDFVMKYIIRGRLQKILPRKN